MTSNSDDTRDRMVESLMDPGSFPHESEGPVEHISTHISDVFLAGDYAYKIKKPINFGFCDFSTPELREYFTRREIELNRRLSEDVYLSVEPVNLTNSGNFRIGGEGQQVEWALKMRRLRSDDQLDLMLNRGDVGDDEVKRVAHLLADFHRRAQPAAPQQGTVSAVSNIVLGNLERVVEHEPPELDAVAFADISAYAEGFLGIRGELIRQRYAEGKPRLCHGDLHAGNIFFEQHAHREPSIQVIDCIEFNEDFAQIDPAADIAFLSMDLKKRGFADMAHVFITTYVEASSDSGITSLLPFYESYRAMVRCMTNSISAEQSSTYAPDKRQHHVEEANAYLHLACDINAQDRPGFLAVIAGVTGTGKSTIAKLIADQWDAVMLNSDTVRRELAGIGPTERTGAGVRKGIYSSEMSKRTYAEMRRRARMELAAGRSVVIDGTHLQGRFRHDSLRVGRDADVLTILVGCTLERKEALRRLDSRYASGTSESEGRPEVYEQQAPLWEPPTDDEADVVVHVDTGINLNDLTKKLFTGLWNGVLATSNPV